MKCDDCGAINPTVHLTEIINGEVSEVHLCESCAADKMEHLKKPFNMSEFLSGIVESESVDSANTDHSECVNCGISYDTIREVGRVGCSLCYGEFNKQLMPLLRKIHKSVRHTGKRPNNMSDETDSSLGLRLADLKLSLEHAVKLEEFESAVTIRDEIKEIETKLRNLEK